MDKPISNVNGEMSVNVKESSKTNQKKMETIWTRVGLVLVIAALIGLLFFPDTHDIPYGTDDHKTDA